MDTKLETISNLFEDNEIRSIWNNEKEEYYFSIVDIIAALTNAKIPRNYWSDLKRKLINEGSELHEKIVQLKMKAQDGKLRETDTLDTKGILRLIESVPSPKAEPFKLWLANLGSERIDEVFDPEIAVNRAVEYYRRRGYNDKWIKTRLTGIVDRFKLTDVWKEQGITKDYEYGILTNEIYKSWSGMKASEYKKFKGIRKESLRDNMTDIEVALTDLGEIATRELAKEHKPFGLEQNRQIAKRGGNIAKITRDNLEKELGRTVISNKNSLNYEYIDEKLLEDKKEKIQMKTKQFNNLIKDLSACDKCVNFKCSSKSLINIYKNYEFCINIPSIWTDWLNRLNSDIMIIGQDWGPYNDMKKLHNLLSEDKSNWNELIELEKSNTKKMLEKYIKESSNNEYYLDNIYITNAIMCARKGSLYRGNNINLKTSTLNCSEYLLKQIEIVKPKVILTLGYYPLMSLSRIFNFRIGKTLKETIVKLPEIMVNNYVIIPLYHPVAQIKKEEQLTQYKRIWKYIDLKIQNNNEEGDKNE